ncbi:endonuclease/exonuclease/phosphatase family protein [Embleya sp. NBC_00896]|uniref:endonuclease/exonuclease/phosphatase family protein n=1 Tax=Embleya sp. NBC_00896 TaxID=2975961 RepID=UPI002F90AEC0|nr:endonuclease/exonuclease/phosphatase family protein [Embleya sp. NBC_00896]
MTIGTWNLENLFRPGEEGGPKDDASYRAKLAALASTINRLGPDLLGIQEVGNPDALADLVDLLDGQWHTALSAHPDGRRIRVGFLGRKPLTVVADVTAFPAQFGPVQTQDTGVPLNTMGRGGLAVTIEPRPGHTLTAAVCHLKSKLLTYPGNRHAPRNEGERARYAAYALWRRGAEATTMRALADQLLAGDGRTHDVALLGDLNDQPQAATTQILYGPPGSQIGTGGFTRADNGDAARLWNLAPRIPEEQRFSRVFEGQGELIDHILVSHALLARVDTVFTGADGPLPSVTTQPAERQGKPGSDHAPVVARLEY